MTMLRTLIPVLIVLTCYQLTSAQQRCDFDQRMLSWDGERLQQVEQRISSGIHPLKPRTVVTIPVVFHVVYQLPSENISDLQIQSQIDILNRDFAFASENVFSVPDEFYQLGGDSEIRFCLASIDPQGSATTGITRTQTNTPLIGTHRQQNGRMSVHYDQYGGEDAWDPERYINVWVAPMEGLLGTATFPDMAPFPEEDGIVMDPRFVGAFGSAAHAEPFDRGHTLTHELGHYFGLYHIWGMGQGSCGADDFIEDTPVQEHAYLGCPDYPQFSCGSSDMFMNFMDFTTDRCLALFTQGQIARMQAVLAGPRMTLLENDDLCGDPDTGKVGLDQALIFSVPESNQIIIVLPNHEMHVRHFELFSIDGRLVRSTTWQTGETFWIDTEGLAAGVYVVRLEEGGDTTSVKVVLY